MSTPEELLATRWRQGKTQAEMAELLGVSVRTYIRWEQGDYPMPQPAAKLLAMIEEGQCNARPSKPSETNLAAMRGG